MNQSRFIWMIGRASVIILTVIWLSIAWAANTSVTHLVIAGAGTSTEITALLAQQFCQAYPDYEIRVPRQSIKHAGALRWVTEQGHLLGRLGRPISKEDIQQFPNAHPLPMACVKIGFATQRDMGVDKLTQAQFQQIYQGQINNWRELGGIDQPIIRFGRESTESAMREIVKKYPFFQQGRFFKLLRKDHEMIDLLCQVPGSIGFAEHSALKQQEKLQVLEIEGFDCGLEIGLVYDANQSRHRTIKQMKDYIRSSSWRQFLEEHPCYAPLDIKISQIQ